MATGEADHLDRLQSRVAHVVQEALTGAEKDRDDVQVEFVEQPPARNCWMAEAPPATTLADRVLQALVGSGDEAVEGDRYLRDDVAHVV